MAEAVEYLELAGDFSEPSSRREVNLARMYRELGRAEDADIHERRALELRSLVNEL